MQFVLVERFNDGAEPAHDLAPYGDADKAFRALLSLVKDVPEYYGGPEPVRRLVVLERKYEPQHGKLPRRTPGAAYGLSVAPEAVEPEYAHEVEAT